MKKYIVVFIVLFIVSCSSSKRAIKAINKGFGIDSAAASKRVREIVPCVTLKQDTVLVPSIITNTIHDTTKTVKDTTITLPCLDGTTVSTKISTVTYTIRSLTTFTKTFYITKTIEDKGKDIIIRDKNIIISNQVQKTNFCMAWAIISTLLLLLSIIFLLIKKSLNKIP